MLVEIKAVVSPLIPRKEWVSGPTANLLLGINQNKDG